MRRWERLALGTVLVALALGLPAAGLAQAHFGSTAQVTITISVGPSAGATQGP
ncbi:hypothetical protein [Cellulomonas sp. NPDC089187]|uniref:hypothetical protein n=1 Tax=Cellulomonas sp. NPDC089187 TaxID=3154970 RepID=UPI00341E2B9E